MATTEEEVIDLVRETRIDWAATPQSVMGPESGVIKSQGDLEAYQQRERDLVGYGYFYIDVRNMQADLALMRSTKPGYWETEIIPQQYSPLLPHDLERALEEAGGAIAQLVGERRTRSRRAGGDDPDEALLERRTAALVRSLRI